MSKECYIVEKSTGEIINEDFVVDELKDIQRKKEMVEKNKLSQKFKELEDEYLGNFVFYVFKNIDKLETILNDNYLVKFLYCCSYVKKNGTLMLDNNITYINRKKLKGLLKIGDKTFNKFYRILKDNELIKEQDNKIYININICWRGSKKEHETIINGKFKDFTRLYIKTIRELYENTPLRHHKQISIVYKLIPYTNWQYNILCTIDTVEEIDKNKIKPLRINDIMDILKYNKTHITRFKKNFYSLKYNEYNIFGTVQFESDFLKSFIIVNPVFFYRGNDPDNLNYLITLFGLSKINK